MYIMAREEAAPIVATSSYEVEYMAAFTMSVECVWLKRLLIDLSVGQECLPLPSLLIARVH